MKSSIPILIALSFFALLTPLGYAQNTVFVDTTAPGNPPGVHTGADWQSAFLTIQEGIDTALAGEHVLVAEGTYYPTTAAYAGGGGRNATILIANSVHIRGGYKGWNNGIPGSSTDPKDPDGVFNKTILTAINPNLPVTTSYHVIVADSNVSQETHIDGFKVMDGLADGTGSNRDTGAGLLVIGGDVLVENVRFKSNVADADGGAVWYNRVGASGSFRCRHSVFRENYAGRGGAVFVADASDQVELANLRFRDNGNGEVGVGLPYTTAGGALYFGENTTFDAYNCVFHDNVAKNGGAVYWDPLDTNLPNAIDRTFRNCTFSFNVRAPGIDPGGAGIHIAPGSAGGEENRMHIHNCILWGNTGGSDLYVDGAAGTLVRVFVDYSDLGTYTDVPGGTIFITNSISADPLFVNPAARNLRLLSSSSPCVDTGSNGRIGKDVVDVDENGNSTEEVPWDKDGDSRVQGPIVDMGAYEAAAPI